MSCKDTIQSVSIFVKEKMNPMTVVKNRKFYSVIKLNREFLCLVAEESGFPLPEAPIDMPPPPAPDGLDLPAPPPLPCDENFEGTKVAKQKHVCLKVVFCFV